MTLDANSTTTMTVPFEFMRSGPYEIAFTLTEFVGHSRQRQLDRVIKEVYALVSMLPVPELGRLPEVIMSFPAA